MKDIKRFLLKATNSVEKKIYLLHVYELLNIYTKSKSIYEVPDPHDHFYPEEENHCSPLLSTPRCPRSKYPLNPPDSFFCPQPASRDQSRTSF